MRIHSKFQDYYDSCIGYGIDELCHYVRKTEEFEKTQSDQKGVVSHPLDPLMAIDFYKEMLSTLPDHTYGWAHRDSNFEYVVPHVFLFCGKMYVGFKITIRKDSKGNTLYGKQEWVYSVEDIGRLVSKYGNDTDKKNWNRKKYEKDDRRWYFRYKLTNKRHMEEVFERFNAVDRDDLNDYHHETGIPVMLIIPSRSSAGHKLVFNPVLKDYEFYKVVDAFTAFQELSMFISGVLGGQSPKMVEISNEDKIHKAGFNEMSFRKEKEK